ncbi:MAG: hypothetical protein HQK97_02640 [Nitrospirae bacterium]|nr:hypothetical protein [Nitrospirota bacterium]
MVGIGAAAGLLTSTLSSMVGINGQSNNTATGNIFQNPDFLTEFNKQTKDKTTNMITALDKDGDGKLSAQEIGLSPQQFAAIDTNGDGKLDSNELNAAYIKQEITTSTQNLMQSHDLNGDGKLTASELNMSPDDFAKIDPTGSGAVGMQELLAANPLNSLLAQYTSTANMFTGGPASAANTVQRLDLTA